MDSKTSRSPGTRPPLDNDNSSNHRLIERHGRRLRTSASMPGLESFRGTYTTALQHGVDRAAARLAEVPFPPLSETRDVHECLEKLLDLFRVTASFRGPEWVDLRRNSNAKQSLASDKELTHPRKASVRFSLTSPGCRRVNSLYALLKAVLTLPTEFKPRRSGIQYQKFNNVRRWESGKPRRSTDGPRRDSNRPEVSGAAFWWPNPGV
jgi:hypothetical protein